MGIVHLFGVTTVLHGMFGAGEKLGGVGGGVGVEAFDIYFCVLFGSYCQSLIFVSTSKLEVFLKFPDFLRSYDFSPLAANLPSWLY